MKAAICLKQVPDCRTISADPQSGRLLRDTAGSMPNPADLEGLAALYAMKQGRELGCSVALTMGPKSARACLREALAQGVDEAIHLRDAALAGADVYATAYALAQALKAEERRSGMPIDWIWCGRASSDSETGQLPGELAALRGAAYVPNVLSLRWADEKEREQKDGSCLIVVQRFGTARRTLLVEAPAVLTPADGGFPIRYPSLRDRQLARRKDILTWSIDELPDTDRAHYGYAGSKTKLHRMFVPTVTRQATELDAWSDEWLNRELAEAAGKDDRRIAVERTAPVAVGSVKDVTLVDTGDDSAMRELIGAAAETGSVRLRLLTRSDKPASFEGAVEELISLDKAEKDEAYLAGVISWISTHPTDAVLFPADDAGCWLAAQTAARCGLGLTASCTGFSWEGGSLLQIRPAFDEQMLVSIQSVGKSAMATVRRGVFPEHDRRGIRTRCTRMPAPAFAPSGVTCLSVEPMEEEAALFTERLVVFGAGFRDPKQLERGIAWAEKKGLSWGVTRALVEAGFAPRERQIGVSGHSVHARFVLLLGVSGSRQTMLGLSQARRRVAVNTDRNAPVLRDADAYYIGSWEEIVSK
ncbi:MAG: FAD-binding protein [Ndongobacter sp.]|nr:FAD-binding protein [Ndongobacter sp.]